MTYDTLHSRLNGSVQEALKKELKQKNIYALPRIEKVVVSTGISKTKMDSKEMHEYVGECMADITGQRPVFTKAKKAISNFKTREGMTVGAQVTLRGPQMEQFLDRLLSYALPRICDFRGLSRNLDGQGNYSIGIKDHSIFPEVPPPDAKQIFGLQVQIKTTTDSDEEAIALLKQVGVPFRPQKDEEEEAKEAEKAKKAMEEKAVEEAKEKESEATEESKESEDKDPKDPKDPKEESTESSSTPES